MIKQRHLCSALVLMASIFSNQTYADYKDTHKEPAIDATSRIVTGAKKETALEIAHMLNDASFARLLNLKLAQNDYAMINSLSSEYSNTKLNQPLENAFRTLRDRDLEIRRVKGIDKFTDSLLEVRLWTPTSTSKGNLDVTNMLIAYEPAGSEKTWKSVEAYDRFGNVYRLDPKTPPAMPILIAGINGREDLRAGMNLLQQAIRIKGWNAPETSLEATKITKVQLKDTQEPWILGKAEVYALISGLDPLEAKPAIHLIDMPYLAYSNTEYKPNQIAILWGAFRFGAANLQLFEHDDNYNYQDLVNAIITGVEKSLITFKPEYATIATIAGAIVKAMPSSFFTNDDDYVDSFYTLEKGKTYTNYIGAASNATVTLEPYTLPPL